MHSIQTIKLVYGQDLLTGLTEALAEKEIKDGVIVAGIGSDHLQPR